ncbi:sodium- and chloride-dependent glycine transporter 1-like [Haliotis rufescens]|uniref:sodium- and chloride-dependent glycine transporter 1-like n=1 Tax=Haliotis rufescens TaxID=6454 RepID=UPI00201F1207|nr:sodium- and chloride-dependent glycine transporter 1-like [Haliotis rufescens]
MDSETDKGEKGAEVIPLSESFDRSDSGDDTPARGTWGSQIDYLLSVIGFCVGLGNVWRFPYICNRNGGGAFLIPFIVCLVLCGLPLFFLEVAMGQFSGKSATHVWSVCPLMKGVGIGMLIISAGTAVYSTTICAWSLYYTIFSCRAVLPWTDCGNSWNTDSCVTNLQALSQGLTEVANFTLLNGTDVNSTLTVYNNTTVPGSSGWGPNDTLAHTAAEEFWQYKALSISAGLGQLGGIRWELALCLLASWVLIFGCIVKGVRSVGKAVYVTATLPYVILTILFVRGLTLPGGTKGVLFYITPDFSKLLEIQVWLEACLQVFYSLGPAWGGLVTMASYNKFNTNCLRNAIICTFVSEGTSLFAGLVIFSILGFMAHEANIPISDVVSSGPGLGFVIYPEALAQLPLPQLWSFVFFIMLILLAMDSLFSLVETVTSAILDEYPSLLKWRVPVTLGYCLVSFLLGLIFTTEGGMYIFQLVDWYFVVIFLIFYGFIECIIFGWVYGVNRVSADIELMLGRPVPFFFKITWCYITPAMLLITFIFTLVQYQPPTYGRYVYPDYAVTIGWCLASIPGIPFVVMMFHAIYKEEGNLVQRFQKSLKPDSSWGPSKSSLRVSYMDKHNKANPLKDTFISSLSCRS